MLVVIYEETLVLICPAVIPNRSVACDSLMDSYSSAMVTTRLVRQLPLSESLSSIVRDDSRNGGRLSFFFSARMHLPRVVSDWLIVLASTKAVYFAPDLFTLSEPARSTNKYLDYFRFEPILWVHLSVKMQWDLLERSFKAWLFEDRVDSTVAITTLMSDSDVIWTSWHPFAAYDSPSRYFPGGTYAG